MRQRFLEDRASDFQGQVEVSWTKKTVVQGERIVEVTEASAKQKRVYLRYRARPQVAAEYGVWSTKYGVLDPVYNRN